MSQTHRTIDPLLNTSVIGPTTKLEKDGLEQYRKRMFSKESIFSPNSDLNIDEESQKQVETPIISSKISRGNSARFITQKRNSDASQGQVVQSSKGKQNMKLNVLKAINKTSLVERFKNNILSTAYILREKQKKQISFYDRSLFELGHFTENRSSKNKKKVKKVQQIFFHFLHFLSLTQNVERVNLKISQLMKSKINYFYIWEFLSLCMQLFKLWYCPFIISFGKYDHTLKGVEIGIVVFIIFDFLFSNLNQVNGKEENTDMEVNDIPKFQTITKIISAIFWTLIYYDYFQVQILGEIMAFFIMTFILRTIKQKYDRQVERLFLQGFNLDLIDLFTLFITIILFAHFICCCWHYIGDITYATYGSWLEAHDIINQSVSAKYIYSFYWATTTIATVGYGDITPRNEVEIVFTIFVMLISSCMFAYSINSIGLIVNGIYESNQKQKRALALLNSYMKKQEINHKLQNRVRNYLKFSNEKEIVDNYEVTQELINSLPAGLQNELKQDVLDKIIKKISLFQNQFSKATNDLISKSLVCIKVTPQDVLYHCNDQNERCLYFLSSGEVKIIEEQSKRILKVAQAGEIFGEFQFFTNQNTRETAICTQFAELYKIDRETCLKIVKQNGKDFQRFHKIKDTILFNQDYSILQQKCQICQSRNHLSLDCPLTRLIPNSYITILKSNFNVPNQRDKFLRSNFKFRSLLQNDQVMEIALQFQDENDITSYSGFDETLNQSEKTLEQQSLKLDEQLGVVKKCDPRVSLKKHTPKSFTRLKTNEINFQALMIRKSIAQTDQKNQLRTLGATVDDLQLIILRENYYANTLENFERLQSYSEYFPNNNIQNVLKQIYQHQFPKNSKPKKSMKIKKGRSNFLY